MRGLAHAEQLNDSKAVTAISKALNDLKGFVTPTPAPPPTKSAPPSASKTTTAPPQQPMTSNPTVPKTNSSQPANAKQITSNPSASSTSSNYTTTTTTTNNNTVSKPIPPLNSHNSKPTTAYSVQSSDKKASNTHETSRPSTLTSGPSATNMVPRPPSAKPAVEANVRKSLAARPVAV
jgi:hypothetical protein